MLTKIKNLPGYMFKKQSVQREFPPMRELTEQEKLSLCAPMRGINCRVEGLEDVIGVVETVDVFIVVETVDVFIERYTVENAVVNRELGREDRCRLTLVVSGAKKCNQEFLSFFSPNRDVVFTKDIILTLEDPNSVNHLVLDRHQTVSLRLQHPKSTRLKLSFTGGKGKITRELTITDDNCHFSDSSAQPPLLATVVRAPLENPRIPEYLQP